MRTAIFAFSFYLLVVALLPCFVFDNCPEDDLNHNSNSLVTPHEQGDGDGCGVCSPFVNCASCSAVILVPFTNLLPSCINLSIITPPSGNYISVIPDEPSCKIWQPPKIG